MIDRQTGGAAAAEKYLGKVIEVQGVVDTASSTGDSPSISFRATGLCAIPGGNSVNCFWMAEKERVAVAKLHPGDTVTVLGRFDESGRYEMPKEYDVPGCAFYINLHNCTVKGPKQALPPPETAVPSDLKVASVRKAAEQGDANAQSGLGFMFDKGQGVPQDSAQAVYWYRKAAEQGYANAQYNLGVMFEKGEGVPQDYAQAVYWYGKAAEQGYANAECNLGGMYQNGEGVPQDYAQAVLWDRKAADQGVANAQDSLGSRYLLGQGVPQHEAQAAVWYRKANEKRAADAQ
jgi:hypothetical protein